jgi:hypothetical protein
LKAQLKDRALDLAEVTVVSVERVHGFFVGPVVSGHLSQERSVNLSKVTPNWLTYQLELISNFHQVRIIANQEAAVVL